MENDIETALAGIIEELETRRALWRNVRDERLKLKRELEASGLDKTAVRKDLEQIGRAHV